MGWGIGNGIGWPNASAQGVPAIMGYFSIIDSCKGPVIAGITSQLIDISIYNEGDYVDYTNPKGDTNRFLLGEILQTPGAQIIELSGPSYSSCPT